MRYRVITYTLHKGVGRRGRDILDHAIAALRARQPDVLACQEVFHPPPGEPGQSETIRRALGHVHVFGPNAFYRRGCHGNATFTGLDVVAHTNIDITESFFERRGMLRTRLRAGDGELEVLNVHLSLTPAQRRRQWARLLSTVDQADGLPLLACGDFNDWSGDLDRRARDGGRLRNALWQLDPPQRRTFPSTRPMLPIDRIYYRGLQLIDVRVLHGEPWRTLSDHLPVEATFEVEDPARPPPA